MNIDEFKIKHSDLIRFFQVIEDDLKLIYAIMREGDLNDNFECVKNFTLGQILETLEVLDKSDGQQYISDSDYKFLKQMTKKRNYWCHNCYVDFLYEDNWEQSSQYAKACRTLEKDWDELSVVCQRVEEAKMRANNYYGRG